MRFHWGRSRAPRSQPDVPEEALREPLERLREFVDRERRRGTPRPLIVSYLQESRWPDHIIKEVVDDFSPAYLRKRRMEPHDDHERLIAFLKEKLDLGYEVPVIERSLTRLGWDPRLIGRLLAELQREAARSAYSDETLKRLRAFIRRELRGGLSREEISERLLRAGWRKRTVEEEVWGAS